MPTMGPLGWQARYGEPLPAGSGGRQSPGTSSQAPLHTHTKGSPGALRSSGGGGWGNPLDREPTRVLADVIRGYVSLEKAASDYGVVSI